jgi:hypothetical protein
LRYARVVAVPGEENVSQLFARRIGIEQARLVLRGLEAHWKKFSRGSE